MLTVRYLDNSVFSQVERKETNHADFKEAASSWKICLDRESSLCVWVGARNRDTENAEQRTDTPETDFGEESH